jgi:hypothetical protein
MRLAVTSLFVIAFTGSFAGLEPFVCCRRALIGALGAYILASFAVKIVNAILINAFVKSQMEQHKGDVNGR